jgi:hypothetical protein
LTLELGHGDGSVSVPGISRAQEEISVNVSDFIVAPRATAGADGAAALKQLVRELGGDAARLKSLVGPPDDPRRAVLSLTPDEARALQERFADRLVIEPDAALWPTSASLKNPSGNQ